ncbi:MAG: divergent polysaccharide deacetylase family protein [Rhizobiales bacterium]|nr:divergent polysaccharide deacetylase family protein [Hyphomicrobiales bacterium]
MSGLRLIRRLKSILRDPVLVVGLAALAGSFLLVFFVGRLMIAPETARPLASHEVAGLLRPTDTTQPPARATPGKDETGPHVPPPVMAGAKPMIAIVIDDMGPNHPETRRALALPAAITFSFLPYAPHVARLADEARSKGHEILVHVPMQPLGDADPGPHALKVAETPGAIERDLAWNLSQFQGYVGINNHMGSRFTQDGDAMAVVAAVLKKRGLLFLDSKTIAGSKAADVARAAGLQVLSRDVFLDHDEDGAQVALELDKLEHLARKNGAAIAIGHPHAQTLELLEKWIPEAQARGFLLVPLTRLLESKKAS